MKSFNFGHNIQILLKDLNDSAIIVWLTLVIHSSCDSTLSREKAPRLAQQHHSSLTESNGQGILWKSDIRARKSWIRAR